MLRRIASRNAAPVSVANGPASPRATTASIASSTSAWTSNSSAARHPSRAASNATTSWASFRSDVTSHPTHATPASARECNNSRPSAGRGQISSLRPTGSSLVTRASSTSRRGWVRVSGAIWISEPWVRRRHADRYVVRSRRPAGEPHNRASRGVPARCHSRSAAAPSASAISRRSSSPVRLSRLAARAAARRGYRPAGSPRKTFGLERRRAKAAVAPVDDCAATPGKGMVGEGCDTRWGPPV